MADRIYIVHNQYYDMISSAFGHGRAMLPSVTCSALSEPVSAHPDMVLFALQKGTVICAKEVFDEYHRLLSPFDLQLVQGESKLCGDYPFDIAYNVLSTPAGCFARLDATDKKIVKMLKQNDNSLYPVRQGYARCSSVSFGNCLITADASLATSGESAGLSVLTITPGFIQLPGYEYGFLGGASGLLDGNTVAFAGDLSTHPDGEAIRRFIRKKGFAVAEIPGLPLVDIGTIFCIEL